MPPSRRGYRPSMLSGVRPSMACASRPKATILLSWVERATTDGSKRTIPLPFVQTSTLTVPRSTPICLENIYAPYQTNRGSPVLALSFMGLRLYSGKAPPAAGHLQADLRASQCGLQSSHVQILRSLAMALLRPGPSLLGPGYVYLGGAFRDIGHHDDFVGQHLHVAAMHGQRLLFGAPLQP